MDGIQIWTVPISGVFIIEARGASGGNGTENVSAISWKAGGLGARIKGEFNLSQGTELKILVGQVGRRGNVGKPLPGSGGGGSFVTRRDNKPLIIAGGGGGGGPPRADYCEGDPGQVGPEGTRQGGTKGGGGEILSAKQKVEAGAGGGLLGDGKGGRVAKGGNSFKKGGEGGMGMTGEHGGFGGGGGEGNAPGGGGGYSGGGVVMSSWNTTAGGGGSFNEGDSPVGSEGENLGDGWVKIELVKPQK